jgi:5-methylcytosine-specific restriction endonuclease McrA
MSPKKVCLEPRCPNLVDDPKYRGRCKEHYLERERERNRRRRADPDRGRRVQVYHSKRWLMLRRRVLFEQPICAEEGCMRLATDCDHIIPMSQGGAEYERENTQGLCAHHHALKSAREGLGGLDDAA